MLEKYLELKNDYLKKYNKDKVFSIFDIKTNMPIKFYEKNGEFIIEISDNKDNSKIYYRRTLIYKNYIDLTFLLEKYQKQLNEMNVEFTKMSYLNRIDRIDIEKSNLFAFKNLQSNNVDKYLEKIDTEYNLLKSEFDQWFSTIKKISLQIDIIQDIYYQSIIKDRNNMNEYTMGYYWLNSNITKTNDDTHYIMSKLIIQSGNIKVGYVIKYADTWHIVTNVNDSQITIQNLKEPFDSNKAKK
jgi:hypothetical protein